MNSEKCWIPAGNFNPRRYRPGGVGNWSGHLPFSNDLLAAVRPKLLVELGTHYGESYFGFCQAIADNNISCVCYAVDTWVGEPHAGYYDESVFREVNAYNADNYSVFSYLLRTTFDEANRNFSEDSIDILHIDGLHTYESVAHDFYAWLPKVKPGGLVLLHDVVGRQGNFGVWKLWEELSHQGPKFAFTHDWGLGVFQKPGNDATENRLLSTLFQGDKPVQQHIRKFYSLCALKLEQEHDPTSGRVPQGKAVVQIYPFGDGGYSADRVYKGELSCGTWQRLRVELTSGFGSGPLRVDLTEQPAVIDIASIAIRRSVDNGVLWTADRPAQLAALGGATDMSVFETPPNQEFCRFISWTCDPQFFVPAITDGAADQPLQFEAWLRIQLDVSSVLAEVRNTLEKKGDDSVDVAGLTKRWEEVSAERDSLLAGRKAAEAQLSGIAKQLTEISAERDTLKSQIQEVSVERDSLLTAHKELEQKFGALTMERELIYSAQRKLQGQLYVTQADLKNAGSEMQQLLNEFEQCKASRKELEQGSRELQQVVSGILSSRSWRLTAPLRAVASRLRSNGN